MSGTPEMPKRDLETRLSRVLTGSVLLAACVGLTGIALYLREHRGARADLSVFAAEPEHLRRPAEIASHAAGFDGEAVLQLCVLLLVLTPVVRVVFSLMMFAAKRDWLYVVVTAVVLGALAVGLVVER
jgi:uncharacterized membrane protein